MTIDERAEGTAEIVLIAMAHYEGAEIKEMVRDNIKAALIIAIEEECEACALICDEMKAELSQRPDKLQYGRTQLEVAEYLANAIRDRKGIDR